MTVILYYIKQEILQVKKIWLLLQSVAILAALSCSSQYGPTTLEDYAAAWKGSSALGIEEVTEMTDKTFATFVHYQGLDGYVPAYKGFILKESDTRLTIVTTQIYQLENYTPDGGTGQIIAASSTGSFVSPDEVSDDFSVWNYRTSYDYAVTGDTIVFDSTMVLNRTTPVSDNLLQ